MPCALHGGVRQHTALASRHSLFSGCQSRSSSSGKRSRGQRCRAAGRLDVRAVIPQLQGDATEQTPPDLPSYLFKERIVYLGMSLEPAVTELLLAELLYLQFDNPSRPIYLYINSAGVVRGGEKLGYESEALSIYDTLKYIRPEVHTLCVGTAFGESALLLAAGKQGKRGALPSSSIMLRQPMQRFTQMQASDVDIYRREMRKINSQLTTLLAKHCGKDEGELATVLARPRYFDPYEAVEFGIVDRLLGAQVLEPGEAELKEVLKASSRLYS